MPLTETSRRRLRSATAPPRRGKKHRGRTAALAFVATLAALYPLLRRPIEGRPADTRRTADGDLETHYLLCGASR